MEKYGVIIKLKILNQYIRNYAKYAFLSNIDALYGDFGSFPLSVQRKMIMLNIGVN